MPNHRSRFARVGGATLPLFALLTASVAAAAPGRGGKPTICQQLVESRPRRKPHQPVFAQPCRASRRSAVVVGDNGGDVNALFLSNGATVPGWPASTGGVPVKSTPSVAPLSPGSPNDSVFVGAGTPADPHEGGYEAFNPNGTQTVVRRASTTRTSPTSRASLLRLPWENCKASSPL